MSVGLAVERKIDIDSSHLNILFNLGINPENYSGLAVNVKVK